MGSAEGLPGEAEARIAHSGHNARLLRLSVSCPRCGSRPALRVTEDVVRAVAHHPPGERLGTYQCQRRQCGNIYELTAAAYQNAS